MGGRRHPVVSMRFGKWRHAARRRSRRKGSMKTSCFYPRNERNTKVTSDPISTRGFIFLPGRSRSIGGATSPANRVVPIPPGLLYLSQTQAPWELPLPGFEGSILYLARHSSSAKRKPGSRISPDPYPTFDVARINRPTPARSIRCGGVPTPRAIRSSRFIAR
jgi:hypothetical protein